MSLVVRQCIINAPAEAVFDFHTDTRNLPLISPPWMKATILSVSGSGKGMRIELIITQFGLIRNTWSVVIAEYERPVRITDTAVRSPFKIFRHERIITPIDTKTSELEDRFIYELPLGIIGKAADRLFVRRFVERMFAYRHRKTREILGRQ